MPLDEAARKRLGGVIAAAREAKKPRWSQVRLATAVGLHPQTVSEIERGVVAGSPDARSRIAEALGLNPADLLAGDAVEQEAS